MRRSAPLRPAPGRTLPFLSALAATALLLTACGTEHDGAGRAGAGGTESPARTQVDDPGKDGVRVTSLTLPSPSPSPTRSYSVSADSLPKDSGIVAAYEVVNKGTETLTYTVIVTFTSADGGAMVNQTVTVRDVGPGKTVRGTVRAGVLPLTTPRVTGAKVLEVTKVPSNEAPAAAGTCPASGIRVSADRGDAAMGLRVVGLHLDNCGTRDYSVDGYPVLELLDDDLQHVDGIKILDGGGGIAPGGVNDKPAGPVTLKPGESALATLVWRNTTQFGTAVNVPYVRVRAKAGAAPVIVTPNLDLGTTGKLGVTAWRAAED
ncbi:MULTISPECIES: DUF4232 domain-containing protein [unclassified Streptomyces]|uniref:DUF4232 domain-containing protein n=1 Tax=unclassified Streptomyces TaxID=2593676 RepID=UPI002E2A9312|nr:DUF4232 domain-containing protein [Streptomyces sp. NBC_00228]